MVRLLNNILSILFIVMLGVYSCKPTKPISDNCNSEKIKFKINTIDARGYNPKTNQPIDYEFCIPDNEMVLKEVLTINPELKKTTSNGRSNCGKEEVLMLGNTDNKAFKSMLCKIANLDYVKEVNQTHWE